MGNIWGVAKSNQIQEVYRFRRYTVNTDLTEGEEEFTCICAKFNKDRILCSHILKIVIENEINTILDKYFLDRWKKGYEGTYWKTRRRNSCNKLIVEIQIYYPGCQQYWIQKDQKIRKPWNTLWQNSIKIEINLDRMLSAQ